MWLFVTIVMAKAAFSPYVTKGHMFGYYSHRIGNNFSNQDCRVICKTLYLLTVFCSELVIDARRRFERHTRSQAPAAWFYWRTTKNTLPGESHLLLSMNICWTLLIVRLLVAKTKPSESYHSILKARSKRSVCRHWLRHPRPSVGHQENDVEMINDWLAL